MAEDKMINEIISFVGKYQESTASIAVFRRILGSYPEQINQETLADLQEKLRLADPDEVESLYFIVK